MNLQQYIYLINDFIANKRGVFLSRLLTYQDTDHSSNETIMNEANEEIINRTIESVIWAPIVFTHIHCCYLLANGDYIHAYKEQATCVGLMSKALATMKEENWMIPVVCLMARDLRLLAIAADLQNGHKNSGRHRDGLYIPNEYLEKAADPLMGLFRIVANDARTSVERSKRIAMMNLVNQLFKIYFRVNKLHLCKPLIRALDNANIMDASTKAQKVTYNYYLGMKNMFDSDYKSADDQLSFSFANCYTSAFKNKRLILIFLIPVKMLLGVMPTNQLLEKYHLLPFAPVVKAVKEGNINELDAALEKHSDFFWKYGIYLILDKLKIIAYRNVFKKVCLILKTHQVPIESFRIILQYLRKEEVSIEEVNCILANLIFEGKIKGYISLAHQKLVISKQNPFPSLNQTS